MCTPKNLLSITNVHLVDRMAMYGVTEAKDYIRTHDHMRWANRQLVCPKWPNPIHEEVSSDDDNISETS